MKTIILTVLIYSLFLTIYYIYRDTHPQNDFLDLLFLGPAGWITYLLVKIATPLILYYRKKQENKNSNIQYTSEQIHQTIKKVMQKVKKLDNEEIFFVNSTYYYDAYNNHIYGLNDLLREKYKNTHLAKKYRQMLHKNFEETKNEIIKYLIEQPKEKLPFYLSNTDKKLKFYTLK